MLKVLLAAWLVALIASDLGRRRLPNMLLLAGAVAAFAVLALAPDSIVGDAADIGLRVAGSLLVLLPAYLLKAMGAGDVKLGLVLALWFPAPVLWIVWTAGGLLGGLHAVALLAAAWARKRRPLPAAASPLQCPADPAPRLTIPYGAYLAMGALLGLAGAR